MTKEKGQPFGDLRRRLDAPALDPGVVALSQPHGFRNGLLRELPGVGNTCTLQRSVHTGYYSIPDRNMSIVSMRGVAVPFFPQHVVMTGIKKEHAPPPAQRNDLNVRVGRRIQSRRLQLGWTSTKLAVLAGLSQSFISKLERGEAGFSPETLSKVAGALCISMDKLLVSGGNVEAAVVDFRSVPVLDYVQAGRWSVVNPNLNDAEIRESVPINLECPPSTFALRIRGDSMEPRFREGDIVIVDPTKQPRPGSFVVAVEENGEATFKQYHDLGVNGEGKHFFELVPLNPVYARVRSDRQSIGIVGVVIEHRAILR